MATVQHCAYCFDALFDSLTDSIPSPVIQLTGDDAKTSSTPKYPLFVTWKKKSSASTPDSSAQWRLRGCIGTFGAKELSKGLKEYAIISALAWTAWHSN